MAKYDTWVQDPSTVSVTTGVPTLSKFYLSTAAVPAGELTAVANAELAQGWPNAVVSRCSSRRAGALPCWIGPNGMSLGTLPDPALVNGLEWLEDFGRPRPMPTEVMETDFYTKAKYGLNEATSSYTSRWANPEWAKKVADTMLRMDLVLIGSVNELGIAGKWHVDTTLGDQIAARMKQLASNDVLVVAIRYGMGDAEGGYAGSRVVYATFVKPAAMRGITGFIISQAFTDVPYLNTNSEGRYMVISGVVAEAGWQEVVTQQKNPKLQFNTTISVGFNANSDLGLTYSNAKWYPHEVDTAVVIDRPWLTNLGLGPAKAGLTRHQVYRLGDPEFVDRMTLIGGCVRNSATRTLAFDSTQVFLKWSGSRLVEMNPEISTADRNTLTNQTFVSVIDEAPIKDVVKLTDLSFYSSMTENEVDVGAQILVPATEDTAAITFAMAEERANKGDRRIHHQVWNANLVDTADIMFVLIQGDGNAVGGLTAEMRSTTNQPMAGTKDDCLYAILSGVPYRFGTITNVLGDKFLACFSISYTELMAQSGTLAIKAQFDEKLAFDGRLPNMHNVGKSIWTAQMLNQHSVNRKQMSSFVVASVVMASSARKKLT